MTPTELRLFAGKAMEMVDAKKFDDSLILREIVWALADHVLSTVREDDDTPLCFAFATIQPGTRYNCGTLYIRGLELELHSYDIGGNPCYLEGQDGWRLETRGQLRRLLEGLGVGDAKSL